MKLVIDIDENIWEMVVNTGTFGCYRFNTSRAIRKGIPLPKGHGRLIDADALSLNAIDDANYGSNYIRIAPTIIEADRKSEDEG